MAFRDGRRSSDWTDTGGYRRCSMAYCSRGWRVTPLPKALTLDPFWLIAKNAQLIGSRWFTVAEDQDMAAMTAAGTLDLAPLSHHGFRLEEVNQAISTAAESDSGFSNVVVMP